MFVSACVLCRFQVNLSQLSIFRERVVTVVSKTHCTVTRRLEGGKCCRRFAFGDILFQEIQAIGMWRQTMMIDAPESLQQLAGVIGYASAAKPGTPDGQFFLIGDAYILCDLVSNIVRWIHSLGVVWDSVRSLVVSRALVGRRRGRSDSVIDE